jgi:nickel-type superoxide dismutase maturation protease
VRGRRSIGALAVTYLVVLACNRSLVEVRGDSMVPTLWAGDRLLTLPSWLLRPHPGRIVVARDPRDPSRVLVKRVHRPVGRDHLDVRGDDPDASTDSRIYGPIPRRAVRRVVVARWPDLRTPLRRPTPVRGDGVVGATDA